MEKLYNEEDSRKTELRRLRSKRECITQGHLKVEAFREALLSYLVCGMFLLFSCSVVSDSLCPQGLQHARLPCPSPSPGVCSNSCPVTQ